MAVGPLVFFASVVVPGAEAVRADLTCWFRCGAKSCWRPRDRNCPVSHHPKGRALVDDRCLDSFDPGGADKLGAIATIGTGRGVPSAFASVVIITMFAAMSFHPRLIWDALEN